MTQGRCHQHSHTHTHNTCAHRHMHMHTRTFTHRHTLRHKHRHSHSRSILLSITPASFIMQQIFNAVPDFPTCFTAADPSYTMTVGAMSTKHRTCKKKQGVIMTELSPFQGSGVPQS